MARQNVHPHNAILRGNELLAVKFVDEATNEEFFDGDAEFVYELRLTELDKIFLGLIEKGFFDSEVINGS